MLAACPFPANHGTPGSIREMAEAIADEGHEVHIVTYHFGEEIPVRGPQLHRIRPLTSESTVVVGPTRRRPLYDLQMVAKTLKVVRAHQPDLIHAHGYEAMLIAWLCRLRTRLPVVYSAHNTMSDELPSYESIRPKWIAKGLAKLLDATVPRLAGTCIPHSVNLESFLRQRVASHRIQPVVNFGIELGKATRADAAEVRRRYQLGEGPVVLYAGVMDEFQRLDLLVEAIAQVAWYEPQVKLLLVTTIANSGHSDRIRRHAERLGLEDRVIITEPQTLDGVREVIPACDVTVVPRPNAPGFPIKLLNYMAAGKPCVLFESSSSGLSHEETAYLVSPDTSDALGEAILKVLRDEDLRASLGRNAFDFVRTHHDRRLIAGQVCRTYYHALGRSIEHLREPSGEPPRVPERQAVPTQQQGAGESADSERHRPVRQRSAS